MPLDIEVAARRAQDALMLVPESREQLLLEAAIRYTDAGCSLIPVHSIRDGRCSCGDECSAPGKHPRIAGWHEAASKDPEQIRRWLQQWRDANIGWVMKSSGVVGLDVDPRNGGDRSLERLTDEQRAVLRATWTQRSGGGGLHYVFASPPELQWCGHLMLDGRRLDGIDVKHRGYILLDPSNHISGGRYQITNAVTPLEAPGWLIETGGKPRLYVVPGGARDDAPEPREADGERCRAYGLAALHDEAEMVRTAAEGERNKALNDAAFNVGTLRVAAQLTREEVEKELAAAARDVGLDTDEIDATIESGLRAGEDKPRVIPAADLDGSDEASGAVGSSGGGTAQEQKQKKPSPAELGSALLRVVRFIYVYATLYRYCDGVYRPDGEDVVRARVQQMLGRAARRRDGDETAYWLAQATRIQPEQLDDGHQLINVENGLLDWRTGELRDHSPDVLSIVQLPTPWSPQACDERADRFLDEVLPDRETRQVVEEFVGYCLWPNCDFQKALMLTGEGANGKSVFIECVVATLGRDNVSSVRLQDFEQRFRPAQLVGKLANVYADLPREALKDAGTFKMLVAGDAATFERKHRDPFTYRNRAKLIFSANELPGSVDTSDAFFRRWIVVPFNSRFDKHTPGFDPQLSEKLARPEARSYLLRLAVEGLRRLEARRGFEDTAATRDALSGYRRDVDNVSAFLHDCCVVAAEERILKSTLYNAYQRWCELEGRRALNSSAFGKRLKVLVPGLREERPTEFGRRTRYYVGVGFERGCEPPVIPRPGSPGRPST